MSYLYNGVAGFAITLVVGYLLSYVIRKISGRKVENEDYDPNLFIPIISRKLRKTKGVKINLETLSDRNDNLKHDQTKIDVQS